MKKIFSRVHGPNGCKTKQMTVFFFQISCIRFFFLLLCASTQEHILLVGHALCVACLSRAYTCFVCNPQSQEKCFFAKKRVAVDDEGQGII